MSCKSLIQDMRGESHGLVQVPVDAFKQSCCWANMPPELLTDVLMRIERSGDTWPSRKDVVSCAGVCRNWRQIVKEMVKVPEVSSKITFPISLKQPGPRGSLVQCYVKRNRSNETFYLYLGDTPSNDDGKFLLAAKKFKRPAFTEYIISLNCKDFSSRSNTYVGKLRSNYLGTKFTVYDAHPTYPEAQTSSRLVSLKQVSQGIQSGNYPVAHISYEFFDVVTLVMGSRVKRPKRMQCVMDLIPATAVEPGGTAPTQTEHDNFVSFRSKSIGAESLPSGKKEKVLVLKSKVSRWDEQSQSWGLPFKGMCRGDGFSSRTFQLVSALENGPSEPENENVIFQFAKVGDDLFIMDYQYPISAFQAFTIGLSKFGCTPCWTKFILKSFGVVVMEHTSIADQTG